MKFLKNLDRLVNFVIGNIAGILLIVMMIMVNVTIFSRWVFNINMPVSYTHLDVYKRQGLMRKFKFSRHLNFYIIFLIKDLTHRHSFWEFHRPHAV